MRKTAISLAMGCALLASCSYTHVPQARSADVAGAYTRTPASVMEPPAAPSLPLELSAHTLETEDLAELRRVAADLGETPESLMRASEEAYVLFPGDKILVDVPSGKDMGGEVVITPDGTVSLKGVGAVGVGGKTLPEAQDVLRKEYAKILNDPQVFVSLREPTKRSVTLTGDLEKPTRVDLLGTEGLVELFIAGGVSLDTLRGARITIMRGRRMASLDASKVAAPRSAWVNLRVRPNDIVLLTRRPPVTIAGEVGKGGSYPVPTRGWFTLREALVAAGWHTPGADLTRAILVRADGRQEVRDINAEVYDTPSEHPVLLYPGDRMSLPTSRDMGVYVLGMVRSPGLKHRAGRMTVLQALTLAESERFGAVLDHAVVVRDWENDPKVLQVNIDRLLRDGDLSQNLDLRDGDILYIPQTAFASAVATLNAILAPIAQAAATDTAVTGARSARYQLKIAKDPDAQSQ